MQRYFDQIMAPTFPQNKCKNNAFWSGMKALIKQNYGSGDGPWWSLIKVIRDTVMQLIRAAAGWGHQIAEKQKKIRYRLCVVVRALPDERTARCTSQWLHLAVYAYCDAMNTSHVFESSGLRLLCIKVACHL